MSLPEMTESIFDFTVQPEIKEVFMTYTGPHHRGATGTLLKFSIFINNLCYHSTDGNVHHE